MPIIDRILITAAILYIALVANRTSNLHSQIDNLETRVHGLEVREQLGPDVYYRDQVFECSSNMLMGVEEVYTNINN